MADDLNSCFFSVTLDESTTKAVETELVMCAQYWCPQDFKTKVQLLDMKPCHDKTAVGITGTFTSTVKSHAIKESNLVAFAGDTCNVMHGVNNSVAVHLKKHFPSILNVKCQCHQCHLVAFYATKAIPSRIIDFIHEIGNWFARSSNRRFQLQQVQQFLEQDVLNVLKVAETRWLSLQDVDNRLLEIFEPLDFYFNQEVEQHPNNVISRHLLSEIRNPFTRKYMEFLSYALGELNDFNTAMQTRAPMLHEVKKRISRVIHTFASNFMELFLVRDTDPLEIDPEDESYHLPLNEVYTGMFI